MIEEQNQYTLMQKAKYSSGTSNHDEHNSNPDYWDILLKDTLDSSRWKGKSALDFACGKGRNVVNLHKLCSWSTVDGIDISQANIDYCKETYKDIKSKWYCNNGTTLQELQDNTYDFVMSTIALQHIPVYSIRRSLISDILRVMKPGGIFTFQMGFGKGLDDVLGRPKSSYYEEAVNAGGTNSDHDVRVQSVEEIEKDLVDIGFADIKTVIRPAYSDIGHPEWIYVNCKKP